MENLTSTESRFLRNLSTPKKIQDYLESIPFNHEESGETCMSPRRVLQLQKAHCLEGAMLASCALQLQKRKPLVMSLKVTPDDYDHVVALYQENGYWGAISKTNHAVLGFRDPVYKSIRELAMSYFHEYFLVSSGKKTLRGYSKPINLNRFGKTWITSIEDVFIIGTTIANMPHNPIIPQKNKQYIRSATALECKQASISRDGK